MTVPDLKSTVYLLPEVVWPITMQSETDAVVFNLTFELLAKIPAHF